MTHRQLALTATIALALVAPVYAQNGTGQSTNPSTAAHNQSTGKNLNNGSTAQMEGGGSPAATTNVGDGNLDPVAGNIDQSRAFSDSRVLPYGVFIAALAIFAIAFSVGVRAYRRRYRE